MLLGMSKQLVYVFPSFYNKETISSNIYILRIFSYGEVAGWGDSGSHTGFRTALSGGFPCGFNVIGRLGPLYEAGQTMGLCGHWAY